MSIINALSRLLDNGQRQTLSFFDEVQRTINDFDFDAGVKSLRDGFNDFFKNVKETISDFKLIVPFDERCETFEFNIENGMVTVNIEGDNSSRTVTATIPSNCKIDEAKHFIDSKHRNLVIVIPKNLAEDENVKKLKEKAETLHHDTASWLKNALKERAEKVASSTQAPTSKPKAAKTASHKFTRDEKGRFVSAKH